MCLKLNLWTKIIFLYFGSKYAAPIGVFFLNQQTGPDVLISVCTDKWEPAYDGLNICVPPQIHMV